MSGPAGTGVERGGVNPIHMQAIRAARLLLQVRCRALILETFVARALAEPMSVELVAARLGYSAQKVADIMDGVTTMTIDEVSDVLLAMGGDAELLVRPYPVFPRLVLDEGREGIAAP